jgi:hypothetical protein
MAKNNNKEEKIHEKSLHALEKMVDALVEIHKTSINNLEET